MSENDDKHNMVFTLQVGLLGIGCFPASLLMI